MKKIFIFIIAIFLLPFIVMADSHYTTDGVIIADNDYNNLRLIYSERYIENMDSSEYYNLMNMGIDFNNISKEVEYVKTEYNILTDEITNYYLTEEEYNNEINMPSTISTYIETSYKNVSLFLAKTSNQTALISIDEAWTTMPTVRSFDVIAMRLTNMSITNGTQTGKQFYTLSNGTMASVTYSYNGTNINNFSNGFGISMNLVDNDITELSTTISGSATIVDTSCGIVAYGTYQHAVQYLTLAQSKSYSLSGSGLGGVLYFTGNIGNKYDKMAGLYKVIHVS